MASFSSDLYALVKDLVEVEEMSEHEVFNRVQDATVRMRGITNRYGDSGRVRGGPDYLARLFRTDRGNGVFNPKDPLDDLIVDHLERGEAWGVIVTSLMAAESMYRSKESLR